ncbi:hypothetical protein CHO01_22600 [Cellulomonas hominis]|uniref:Uncharacterized protein n=1 Tax=Cellulomonas hominis TaxID=156981 RepID=A0A511FEX6_9CELL|nr:FHIPEP family type III secretion protein [Cellulomonas hominis]MBB5474590.1 hypothetical protein [Cellulomonas hominis]NKY06236.1 FHIPEP family type III secretion protein [Cellulomonas hominis]GEL47144.1 hypothetical protein CHO01_22600 [Cellulomonas hominis]
MRILSPTPTLPNVDDVRIARPRDTLQLCLRQLRGVMYSVVRNPWLLTFVGVALVLAVIGKVVLALLAACVGVVFLYGGWIALSVATGLKVFVIHSQGGRFAASIGLLRTRRGWLIDDHTAARPGSNQGAALRSLLGPALAADADSKGVTILTRAATAKLSERYAGSLPGLHRAPGQERRKRGIRMVREPSAPVSPTAE